MDNRMNDNTQKKVALVTGGSRGIGQAICERLARDGMDIVFTYSFNEKAAAETVTKCEARGVRAYGYMADAKDSQVCSELVKKIVLEQGRIDVLVNNAGITRDNLIMRMTDADLDAVLDVNLKGSFYMMREVSRVMLKQRRGRIINISSVVGLMGNAGQVNYAASKAAVIGMTRSLARELASRKITVNAVAPGMIATDMTGELSDKTRENILASIPLQAMGKPSDVANTVAFLAGEESGYITGQVLCVDGGMAI